MVIISSWQDGWVVELHRIKFEFSLTLPLFQASLQGYKFPSNLLCPGPRLDWAIKKPRKAPFKSLTYSAVVIVAQVS